MSGNAQHKLQEHESYQMEPLPKSADRHPQLSELMLAIVFTAVQDLQGKPDDRKRAIRYIQSTDDEYLFSFQSICSYLGYDPETTRWKILNRKSGKIRRRKA